MIRRLLAALGLCKHRDTYRDTVNDVRVFRCSACGKCVEQLKREQLVKFKPAHESMKARRVPKDNVLPMRRSQR